MALDKYLAHYAAAEAGLPLGPLVRFAHCLVIPARDEAPLLLDRLMQLARDNPGLLCVLVINQPEDQSVSARNRALAARIGNRLVLQWSVHERKLCCFTLANDGALLVVDRFSDQGIPAAEGVGTARKIGCDIACRLFAEGRLQSPWIHCSDADVHWPAGYFEAARDRHGAALVYPFSHRVAAGADGLPGALYELQLRYYVAGLRAAGSPYGYHSIGSTIAVHADHYAMVRGFPRRAGGEDFYLLNKLRKTGAIVTLATPRLELADRVSRRVPFGTGPALSRIARLDDPVREYPFYHPGVFPVLHAWLALTPRLFAAGDPDRAWDLLNATAVAGLPAGALAGLIGGLDGRRALQHAFSHGRDLQHFAGHLHGWFDAFRTLKLIHALRESHLPSLGLDALLEQSDTLAPTLARAGLSPHLPDSAALQRDWLMQCNEALAADEKLHLAHPTPSAAESN